MNDMSNQSAVTALLTFLAVALLHAGIPAMLIKTDVHRHRARACIVLAVLLFLAAYYWSSVSSTLGPRLTGSVEALATNAWVWFAFILMVLLYTMAWNIAQTIKDKHTVDRVYATLEAYVLPRSLTPRQKGIIADHLSRFESREITFEVIENDNEASNFMVDIRNAVDQGGWTMKERKSIEKASEGLAIDTKRPQNPQAVGQSKRPQPEDVLREAFLRANVPVDGGFSSGGSVALTEEVISIRIGPRRRDTGVLQTTEK